MKVIHWGAFFANKFINEILHHESHCISPDITHKVAFFFETSIKRYCINTLIRSTNRYDPLNIFPNISTIIKHHSGYQPSLRFPNENVSLFQLFIISPVTYFFLQVLTGKFELHCDIWVGFSFFFFTVVILVYHFSIRKTFKPLRILTMSSHPQKSFFNVSVTL